MGLRQRMGGGELCRPFCPPGPPGFDGPTTMQSWKRSHFDSLRCKRLGTQSFHPANSCQYRDHLNNSKWFIEVSFHSSYYRVKNSLNPLSLRNISSWGTIYGASTENCNLFCTFRIFNTYWLTLQLNLSAIKNFRKKIKLIWQVRCYSHDN